MPWVRIDEHAMEHPKVAGLPDGAFRLWVVGLAHCQKFLTDGFIAEAALRAARGYSPKRRRELVAVGLWLEVERGVQIHDYLEWNDSRQVVLENRDWGKRRRELYADPALLARIRARDRDCCRYCGKPVNWRDRRGPLGGTYDHVIARGPNTEDNVVVACRGCNAAKGDKPLDSCGMRLLPVPELVPNQNGVSRHISGVGGVVSSAVKEGCLGETAKGRLAFGGAVLEVPRFLDEEFVRRLNGQFFDLTAFYLALDQRLTQTGEPYDLRWIREQFAAESPSPERRRADRADERPFTPAERAKAERHRRSVWGGCKHDPPCDNAAECIAAIIRHWRAQEQPA